ncbi:hypothetical protein CKA32_005296 [Geitlerinema sp. FC II]|nr:hypothetical protein CKA32_005296 [Geitlerinema sp. FC II]
MGFGDRDFNLNDNDFVARKPGVVDEWGLGDRRVCWVGSSSRG